MNGHKEDTSDQTSWRQIPYEIEKKHVLVAMPYKNHNDISF